MRSFQDGCDPHYETPEERAEIEAACENIWKNRYQLPVCSDLLWRMQVSSSNFSQKKKKKNIVNKKYFYNHFKK